MQSHLTGIGEAEPAIHRQRRCAQGKFNKNRNCHNNYIGTPLIGHPFRPPPSPPSNFRLMLTSARRLPPSTRLPACRHSFSWRTASSWRSSPAPIPTNWRSASSSTPDSSNKRAPPLFRRSKILWNNYTHTHKPTIINHSTNQLYSFFKHTCTQLTGGPFLLLRITRYSIWYSGGLKIVCASAQAAMLIFITSEPRQKSHNTHTHTTEIILIKMCWRTVIIWKNGFFLRLSHASHHVPDWSDVCDKMLSR